MKVTGKMWEAHLWGSLATCLDTRKMSNPLGRGRFCLSRSLLVLPSFNCKRSPQANIPSCLLMWFVPAWLSPHPTPAVSSGVGGSQWAQRKQFQHLLQSWDAQSYLETGSLCFLIVILATAHCWVDLSNTDQLLTDTQSSKGPL